VSSRVSSVSHAHSTHGLVWIPNLTLGRVQNLILDTLPCVNWCHIYYTRTGVLNKVWHMKIAQFFVGPTLYRGVWGGFMFQPRTKVGKRLSTVCARQDLTQGHVHYGGSSPYHTSSGVPCADLAITPIVVCATCGFDHSTPHTHTHAQEH
jgi:hypothetical protein